MLPGEYFFFAALFFLGGVGGASLNLNVWILIANAVLMIAFLILWMLKKERRFLALGALSLLITAGAVYCQASVMSLKSAPVPFGNPVSFSGIIDNDPKISGGSLDVILKVPDFGGARLLVKLPRYPMLHYGDVLNVSGEIKSPTPASYANYLLKERVLGTMSFPQASLAATGRGTPLMAWLYSFKHSLIDAFNQNLPAAEAALAAGLTVGERGGFSSAFNQAMKGSGTTHLVALSGYNIMVIVTYATALFLLFCRRRTAVVLTVPLIIAFVLMTGAEASVVRAAIMGFILLLAKEVGRFFNVRNAIMLAGLVMVLFNPQVLVFDVGFILSFLALIGLVYLAPVLQGLFKYSGQPGFLAWRESLFTTTSAQVMVLPILIQNFGGFSPVSLISNVLILGLVPLTMGLSFALAGLSFVSSFLASLVSLFLWPLLRFEVDVIEFFGRLPFPTLPAFGWILAVLYYILIAGFIVWWNSNHKNVHVHRG